MGFFDSLTDIFTNKSANDAFRRNQWQIDQTSQKGQQALNIGYGNAQNALAQGNNALTSGYMQGRDALNTGYSQGQAYLDHLYNMYAGLTQSGQQANKMWSNANGLNGTAGSQAALEAFHNSGFYNAGLNSGLNSVSRLAASRGDLSGGNTTRDLYNYASDRQNQNYGQYVSSTAQQANQYAQGLAGQGSALHQQAQNATNQGSALAQLLANYAGGINTNQNTSAQTFANQGNSTAGFLNNIGLQNIQNSSALAQAINANSNGIWNSLGGLLNGGANFWNGINTKQKSS